MNIRHRLDWLFALVMELNTTPGLASALDGLRERLSTAPWPDADTWGTGAEAQRGAQAMADLLGGLEPRPDGADVE